ASVDWPARPRAPRRRRHRHASGGRRQPGRRVGPRGRGDGSAAAGGPQHHPRRAGRPVPCARAHSAALLRPHTAAPARGPPAHAPNSLMIDSVSKAFFHALAGSRQLKALASRYGMRDMHSFARRFIAGETVEEAIDAARKVEATGLLQTLDYLGESVASVAKADQAARA